MKYSWEKLHDRKLTVHDHLHTGMETSGQNSNTGLFNQLPREDRAMGGM